MAGNNGSGNGRGRPKSTNPKIKLDNVRLKTTTMMDFKMIAEEIGVNESVFLQTILENELPKYKKLMNLEDI